MSETSNTAAKRWLLDHEVEHGTGGTVTASRLRKDRIGKQLFPFHRVGRNCYYDLAEVHAVIEGSRFGGKTTPAPQPKRAKAAA